MYGRGQGSTVAYRLIQPCYSCRDATPIVLQSFKDLPVQKKVLIMLTHAKQMVRTAQLRTLPRRAADIHNVQDPKHAPSHGLNTVPTTRNITRELVVRHNMIVNVVRTI